MKRVPIGVLRNVLSCGTRPSSPRILVRCFRIPLTLLAYIYYTTEMPLGPLMPPALNKTPKWNVPSHLFRTLLCDIRQGSPIANPDPSYALDTINAPFEVWESGLGPFQGKPSKFYTKPNSVNSIFAKWIFSQFFWRCKRYLCDDMHAEICSRNFVLEPQIIRA